MTHFNRMLATGAGAALAVSLLAAAPASADRSAELTALGLGESSTIAATSEFYAGYAGTGVGDGATSAEFRVPDWDCGAEDRGVVITLWAISADGEFLAGPDLFTYCSGGELVLDGHVTTSGGQIPIWQELEPGDKVKLSIIPRSEGPSTHDVAFTNLTRGWTSTLPTNSPVERIEVAHRRMSLDGTRLLPPAYGTFRFSNVVFDDVPVSDAEAKRIHLVDAAGDVLIKTRKATGDNFKLVSKTG